MIHIWPYVGKAKMSLRGSSFFFQLSKIFQFQAVCLQFFKYTSASQTHFGFTNIRSNMHSFHSTAIYFDNFLLEHPVDSEKMFQNKIFQQLPKVKYVTAKKLISKTSKKPKEVN